MSPKGDRAKPRLIRIFRTLCYVGPEDWMERTFARNKVGPDGFTDDRPHNPARGITEIARTWEEVEEKDFIKTVPKEGI